VENCGRTAGLLEGRIILLFSRIFNFRVNVYPQIFKDATLFFSRSTPNLATVIPAMDHIDQHLATQSLSQLYGPAVRVALAMGKKTMNRYYNLTDDSEVYRIAMGMISLNHVLL
jgi:hypothetical protein